MTEIKILRQNSAYNKEENTGIHINLIECDY